MENKLVFTNKTITDSNLYDINYKIDINASDDLSIGNVSSAELVFTTDINTLSIGDEFTSHYKLPNTSSWIKEGIFHITNIEKDRNLFKITAYDNVQKLDKIIDSWLDTITFPITLSSFASSLCTYCGIELYSTTFTNSTFSFEDNFTVSNITGREIMKYISEVAASNVIANKNGKLVFQQYSSTSAGSIDNSLYTELTQKDYVCESISKVWVGTSEDDIGVVSGTGDNVLKIFNNPILYTDSETSIQTQVNNIYGVVSTYSYRPMKLTVLPNVDYSIGSTITVNNIDTYIMSRERRGLFNYESTGNNKREELQVSPTSQINALRGSYTKIKTEVGQISVEVGQKVGNDEIISKINQSPEAITIQANKVNLTGYTTFTDLSTAGQTVINGSNITTGELSADRIKGGTLILGGDDNTEGVLEIHDELDTKIGQWDKDGVLIEKGIIEINSEYLGPNLKKYYPTTKDSKGDYDLLIALLYYLFFPEEEQYLQALRTLVNDPDLDAEGVIRYWDFNRDGSVLEDDWFALEYALKMIDESGFESQASKYRFYNKISIDANNSSIISIDSTIDIYDSDDEIINTSTYTQTQLSGNSIKTESITLREGDVADYIISRTEEERTNSSNPNEKINWTIKKYASGDVECYGAFNGTTGSQGANSNIEVVVNLPTAIFVDNPIVNANIKFEAIPNGGYITYVSANTDAIDTYFTKLSTYTYRPYTIFYSIKGRWK